MKFFLFMLLVFCQFISAAQSFVKVNSGTKSDITDIKMFSENEGYFMADKIYALKNGVEWTKQNFPSNRSITLFSANSANDFWYVTNLENSTSVYYHFHNNNVENFVGPFGVSTYSACLAPDNTPFFSSFTEVALFINGKFQKIALAPTRFSIMKIVARSSKLFWILTSNKELFVYEGEKYRRILKDKNVRDFQIIDERLGYALCDDELIGFNDNIFKTCSVNEELIKSRWHQTKTIMLTILEDEYNIMTAIKNGADGYILKKTKPQRILEAIQQVYEGGAALTPMVAKQVLSFFNPLQKEEKPSTALTRRENEILSYIVSGITNERIASELFISTQTVRNHIKNIYEKLQVHSKAQVVAKALIEKII